MSITPAIRDGITEKEAKIVRTLRWTAKNNPDLIDTLLDPDKVILEEKPIDCPCRQVLLTIIRTRPGAALTMGLLENHRAYCRGVYGPTLPPAASNLSV